MSNLKVTTRYAKSLLDLAGEQGKLEAIFADMQLLRTAVKHKELASMLKSPIISASKKNAVMDGIFSGKVDDLTLAYLKLLTSKGRENELPGIIIDYIAQYKGMLGLTSIKITSAAPLSEEVLEDIKTKLLASDSTAQKLEVETAIDKSLIGGFIVEYNDKRYDASIASTLSRMKSEFDDNPFVRTI